MIPPSGHSESDLSRRYAELCAHNPDQDVFVFLRAHPTASTLERLKVLLVDQKHRQVIGRPLPVRVYLAAFPDIASRSDFLRPLIDAEREGRSSTRPRGPTTVTADQLSSRAETLILPDQPSTVQDLNATAESPERTGTSMLVGGETTQGAIQPESEGSKLSYVLDEAYHLQADEELLRVMLRSVRFTLVRRLGAGGMGVVYEAYDRERGELVALKTMRQADPVALVRFKQEFRSLCDITHPNLVTLYELFAVEDRWFFIMELVEGCDFIRYTRGECPVRGVRSDGPEGCDEARLRSALEQLATGVCALHQAGKLHRDIKPTNVLVTHEGRVVLLDFGLTQDLEEAGGRVRDRQVVGTIGAMSPEQAAGERVTAASDWYSLGVMLFEALTGRMPFPGSADEVVRAKRTRPAPRADTFVQGLPPDLVELCARLLERDPQLRPSGREVIAVAQGTPSADEREEAVPSHRTTPLIGRARHRRVLEQLFADLARGQTQRVYLFGSSGTGKTSLIQAFLKDVARVPGAVVLVGRCYERETVPYKALDSLIDSLARYLKTSTRDQIADLLPNEAGSLSRLFPVLEGVDGFHQFDRTRILTPDRQELKRRGTRALRELLLRLGARCHLVLAVDDLHWGDLDSALLLADLLSADRPPRLLFIGGFRSEDAESGPFLTELEKALALAPGPIGRRELVVEPLTAAESRELALELLGRDDPSARAQAHMIARESGGNPLFIAELVKHVESIEPSTRWEEVVAIDLEDALWSRILKQPQEARELLKIVAVAERPINQTVAFEAAGLGPVTRIALASLRSARLVRNLGSGQHGEIEIYHDRIRLTVLAHLSDAELIAAHDRLAVAYESLGLGDPEILAEHHRGAGRRAEARLYAELAGDQAALTLAFDHAARQYQLAQELLDPSDPAAGRLARKLGDALANAGRAAQAAQAYLHAATLTTTEDPAELKRLASTQLLLSGRVAEGFEILRELLGQLGEPTPETPRQALWSLIANRALLRLRGVYFKRRSEADVPPQLRAKIDLCWAAVAGLSMYDPVRGASFQARGLRHALKAGEPFRIARALAMEATHRFSDGINDHRTKTLLTIAAAIATNLNSPYLHGLTLLAQGAEALFLGHWKSAQATLDKTELLLRDQCTGVAWELDTIHNLNLWALLQMGEMSAFKRRFNVLYREARERGDLYAEAMLSKLYRTLVTLAANEPVDFAPRLEAVLRDRPENEFNLDHAAAFDALFHIDLYESEVEQAYKRITTIWKPYENSMLFRVRMLRVVMHEQRGRAALAAADKTYDPTPYLDTLHQDIQALLRERRPWANAHAAYLQAGLAAARENLNEAIAHLNRAEKLYHDAGMRLRALLIRMRLGEIDASTQRPTRDVIERAIADRGIVAPARWAGMFAPGFNRVTGDSLETSI